MIDRQLETLWADDIRQEIGNKISIMGIYAGVVLVEAFPLILPKLCLISKVVSKAGRPLGKLTIRVLKDDAVWHEHVVPEATLRQAVELRPPADLGNHVLNFQFYAMFSPFRADERTVLRVRAETESEELQGGGLVIDQLGAMTVASASQEATP